MIAILGSELVTAGAAPSASDLGADSGMPISKVLA